MKDLKIEIPKGMVLDKDKYAKGIVTFISIDGIYGTKDFDYKIIKCYEDAVTICPVEKENTLYDTDSENISALKKLHHIIKVINNGWTPDWSSEDQYKYYPWFNVSPSGSGFSDSYYGFSYTDSGVSSRLLTDTREKALYLANQFRDLYSQYLL